MGIEEDSLRELKLLNTNINSLARSFGKMNDSSMSQSGRRDGVRDEFDPAKKARKGSHAADSQAKAVTSYNTAAKKFMKVSGSLSSEIVEANEDLSTLRKSWHEGAEAMFDMKERVDKWGDSTVLMNYQSGKIVQGMSRFSNNLAKTTKAQSLLYSEQLGMINGFKEFEKAAYFDELTKSLGSLDSVAKRRFKLIDEATGKLRTDLDLSDFKKVRSTIGELEASFKEVLAGTDFKSFGELLENGKFSGTAGDETNAVMGNDKASTNRDAVAKMAAILQSRGMFEPKHESQNVLDKNGKLKNAAELNKLDWEGLSASLMMTEKSFARASTSIDKNVDIFNDKWARMTKSLQNGEGFKVGMDSLKKMAFNFLSSGAAFTMAKDKIIAAYQQISEFNIAQIPASYFEVNKASVKLGMSFKDTVKLMDENKRILAIYGPEKFTTAMGTMSKTFQKYGYTMEQAAAMVGPTVESAISAGVNIRDPGQLNTFTDTMMGQFQKISGIVKISAQEFAHLNKTLFQSEGTFETMLGMDTQRRQAYAQELVQLRTKYVAQGLEIQQAQALVEAQQQQQRGHLNERQTDAAKLMTAAQVSGLGADQSMEVFRLATKGRRTADEDKRFAELAGQINQAQESSINAGYGANGDGAAGDLRNELRLALQTSGAVSQITKAGSQMQESKEAGAQVSDKEQAAASKAAKGSESVAALGQAVNTASSIINNAFLGALVASSAALVAFGFQLSRLSLLMGGKAGVMSALGGIKDNIKGIFKGGAGAAGAAGAAASTTGGLAAGMGGMGITAPAAGAATQGAAGAAAGIAEGAGGAAARQGSGLLSKATGFLGKNAGLLGKAAGILGIGLTAVSAVGDYGDVEDQRKSGELTDKQASTKKAGVVGGAVGGIGAGLAGAAIGQVLIPIPGVGALVGGAVGGALGSWLGKSGSEVVANAVTSDTPPTPPTPSKPTPAVEAPVTPTQPSSTQDSTQKVQPKDTLGDTITKAIQVATPTLADAIAIAVGKAYTAAGVMQPTPTIDSKAFTPINSLASSLFPLTAGVTNLSKQGNLLGSAIDPMSKSVDNLSKVTQSTPTPDFSGAMTPLIAKVNQPTPQPDISAAMTPLSTGIMTMQSPLMALIKGMNPISAGISALQSQSPLTSMINALNPLTSGLSGLFSPTSAINKLANGPIGGMPVSGFGPKIGVDSANDTSPSSINTVAQDSTTTLGVQDKESLTELQTIAGSMARAVELLQKLAEKADVPPAGPDNNSRSATAPANNMNQIPSAYQFATGRMA